MTEEKKLTNERTKEKILKAISGSMGILSAVAKKCKLSRTTIHLYANTYPEVREALEAERENIIDLSESKLVKAISGGEAWAIALALKTLGRGRGYAEKQEIENSGEIKIKVVYGNSD